MHLRILAGIHPSCVLQWLTLKRTLERHLVYKWETSEIPSARKSLFNASPNSRQKMYLIPFWKLDFYLFSMNPPKKERVYISVPLYKSFLKFRPSFYFYFYFVGVRELLVSTIPVKLLDIVKITILSLPLNSLCSYPILNKNFLSLFNCSLDSLNVFHPFFNDRLRAL